MLILRGDFSANLGCFGGVNWSVLGGEFWGNFWGNF